MPAVTTNLRILLIDDNRKIHEDFTKILVPRAAPTDLAMAESALFGTAAPVADSMPFDLASAYQGEEGVLAVAAARAEGRPFAVAFVDMRMPPGWDGLETIPKIWERDPEVQVVICTAFSDYSWGDMIARLGHDDRLLILKKPFDSIEVLQLAHALSSKWETSQILKRHLGMLEQQVAERTSELTILNRHLAADAARRQATIQDLAAMKLKVERVLAMLPVMLIGVRRDGTTSHWNDVAASILGIPAHVALGRQLAGLGLRWDQEVVDRLLAAASDGGSVEETEMSIGDGAIVVVSASAMPGTDGEILLFGSDITKRRSLEVHLMQAQKLEAIGQLSAGIAHEINTPTQYVGDNLNFLRNAFTDVERLLGVYRALASTTPSGSDAVRAADAESDWPYLAKEIPLALRQSASGIDEVARIVAAMRAFSHVDHGDRNYVDINAALAATIDVARNEFKYVADARLEGDPQLPKLLGYGSELNQVFLNLIVNAAQAIAEHPVEGRRGSIAISTRVVDDCVEVRVRDNGPGIPAAVRHRIFEPFFTTKPVGKGTGQGLSLSRDIVVKRHGGTLTFESREGEGTTFIARIPLKAPG